MQTIQMQLSKKQKIFLHYFFPFLEFRLNFEHFEEKDGPIGLCIREITDCKIRG